MPLYFSLLRLIEVTDAISFGLKILSPESLPETFSRSPPPVSQCSRIYDLNISSVK